MLCCCTLMTQQALAEKDDNRNPLGCNDVGYTFDLKTLQLLPEHAGAGQSLYFIFNKSKQPITLFQMRDLDSSRSMYFNHKIDTAHWAVLATCESKMKYICTIDDGQSHYGKVVDCKDHLRICEYDNVKFGMNNKGNYWLVNSNNRNAAVREVVRYGIIPAVN